MKRPKKSLLELRTSGFSRLREGRIHIRCPQCGRKQSNALRESYDPPLATLAEIGCGDCAGSVGAKDCPIYYYDAKGAAVPDNHECESCGDWVYFGERHDCDGEMGESMPVAPAPADEGVGRE